MSDRRLASLLSKRTEIHTDIQRKGQTKYFVEIASRLKSIGLSGLRKRKLKKKKLCIARKQNSREQRKTRGNVKSVKKNKKRRISEGRN